MCIQKVIMFSFGVKIQILLFMVVVLVGLYLFVLQKEMRLMQQDFSILKRQIEETHCKQTPKNPLPLAKVESDDEDEDEDDDEDDEDSVSSLEIKEILTNIDIGDTRADIVGDEDVVIADEDLSLFVETELDKLKCEDLRNYLRSRNMDIKGKKPELIQKILSIRE
jgi:hypothetical protein